MISISIITVVYNGEKYIQNTIESVLNQKYPNVEYIIIDGKSDDMTLDIIQKYKKYGIKIISEKDNGIYDAMNKGIINTSGDIVGIINSDDYYTDKAFKLVTEKFNSTDADIVYGNLILRNEADDSNEIRKVKMAHNIQEVRYNSVHPSVFVKRTVYNDMLYNTRYNIASDYEFFLKVFSQGYKIHHIDQELAVMRLGGVSSKKHYEGIKIAWDHIGKKHAIKMLVKRIIRK